MAFEIPTAQWFVHDAEAPITVVQLPSEEEYERLAAAVQEHCSGTNLTTDCTHASLEMNQFLRVANADEVVVPDQGAISTLGGGFDDPSLSNQFGEAFGEDASTTTDLPEIEVQHSALGTLLTPYLLIKWGDVVLHNTFPSEMSGLPIINQNVSSWDIDLASSSSSSGGGGTSGNKFKLVLNPVLVDANGDRIQVQADGKALDVIFGYPGSVMVRRHTFAQTNISDQYFNSQQTTINFKGSEWNIQRFGQQRMYASGKWQEMINTAFKSFCVESGIMEEDCVVNISPEDFEPSQQVSQQIQTGSNQDFIRYLVRDIAGCNYSYNSENPDELELDIDCEAEMSARETEGVDLEANFKLVDNGYWLGEHSVETITISGKIGEGVDSAYGNRCSGYASSYPANEILTGLTSREHCGHDRNERMTLNDPQRTSHYQAQLSKETDYNVPLPAPFQYRNGVAVGGCDETAAVDTECNEGYGNYVEIESTESETLGQVWRFYHIDDGPITPIGLPGDIIAAQSRSGATSEYKFGIWIKNAEGESLPAQEAEAAINEYINTLTRECNVGSWNGEMCYHEDMLTSYVAAPFGPYHIHIDAGKNTLPPWDDGVVALEQEYFDAAAQSGICIDMNGIGSGSCYEVGDTAAVLSCITAHSHSNVGYGCDFWVSDPGTNRFHPSSEAKPFPDPWPNIGRTYYNFGANVEAACVYDNDVRIMHGEPGPMQPHYDKYYPANPWCAGASLSLLEKFDAVPYDPRSEPTGGGYNVSDSDAEAITAWAESKGLNPALVAAFIQGESSFSPEEYNSSGCYGIFQCCSHSNPCGEWGLYDCGSDYICQLDVLWNNYIPHSGCEINTTADIYTCIAFPYCTTAPGDTNLDSVQQGTCIENENWRDSAGNCNCDGIRQYLMNNVFDDPRFPDSEGTLSTVRNNEDGSPCTNSGGTSNLNSAASNSGMGGINGIQFQEKVSLSAEMGINPRNMFLAPTSPGSSTPQYILLSNADNSDGFIDFKIKSVRITWKGHWRISVTAERPGSDGVELPRTLKPPQSYYEWIQYYWYPDPEREAREFVVSDTSARFDTTTGALTNARDDEVAAQDARAQTDVGQAYTALRESLIDNEDFLVAANDNPDSERAVEEVRSSARRFIEACESANFAGCDTSLEEFEDDDIWTSWANRLQIGDQSFRDWYYSELAEPVRDGADAQEDS
jgi:hypothetical protein